jgi:hypothetical protein
MTRKLFLAAIVALLGFATPAPAQYLGLSYCNNRPRVIALVPINPRAVVLVPPVVGVVEKRIIIQPIVPPPYRIVDSGYDCRGIDLDVEPPDRLMPPGAAPPRKPVGPAEPQKEMMKKPEPEKAPAPAPVKPPPPPEPVKKPPPQPEPVKVPPPEPAKKPPPLPEPAKKPPVEDLWQARPGAADESRRLAELGVLAFRAGQYGVALFRFGQANAVDPNNARAFFLRAQAHLAIGQYKEALEAIENGLRLQPDWPAQNFRPRTELYRDNLEDWLAQRDQLDDAISRKPQDATLLFLRGYLAWFEGQRQQGINWFLRARPLTADPRWIDLFLKHAPPAIVVSL